MQRFNLWVFCSLFVLTLSLGAPALLYADQKDENSIAFFEKRIRPVLVEHCYKCHSVDTNKSRGGLVLDSRTGIRKGGDSGPAVVPGNPAKSILMRALRHQGPRMPDRETKLPDRVIADFEAWIKMGAPDPREGKALLAKSGVDYEEGKKHWAYQQVRVVPPGKTKAKGWAKTEIDRYILAAMEVKGLSPTAAAEPRVLLRRLSFDLTGLPPTPDEQQEFLNDTSPKAPEHLVDRLLASPQFGPQWARHWLDGVRFNDSLETVDHYRHWVVDALNADMPYDQFIRAQLAGDLLPAKDSEETDANRVAAQMLIMNLKEMDPIEGIVEVVGQQLLGVSINCAKCHDHKYDAFSQEDYYALAGIFTSSSMAKRKTAETKIALANLPTKIFTLHEGKVGDTKLLIKGDPRQPGDLVPRRFPMVLAGQKETPLSEVTDKSGRLELANWIADADNPLTARVMVNRIWQRLMGRGIVASPNDFGTQGNPPTHPKLLDYLADRFIKSGWSIKAVIREIVLTRTYQQQSRTTDAMAKADPENTYWTRMPMKRLTYEQLHDSLLAVAGRLERQQPKVPLTRKEAKNISPNVRAIYLRPAREAKFFDGPNQALLVEKREASVTAPQMLYFLNNRDVNELAGEIAKRVENLANSDDLDTRVRTAYQILFSRAPTDAECKLAADFVDRQNFTRYCHALLCTNEFIYLE